MTTLEPKKLAIVESDDTEDHYERSGLNYLFYWKTKYPKFKISLFTIPGKTSKEMLELLFKHRDWIELLIHGYSHSSNFECFDWDYDKTKELMEPVIEKRDAYYMQSYYKKIFKAPGWTITPDLCGYQAREDQLITKDKQAVYKALNDLNFIIEDRHYNKPRRLENGKYICLDDNPDIVHMHTWPMPQGSEPNGYGQVEVNGTPWNHDTTFKFISEAWKENLIKPCQ